MEKVRKFFKKLFYIVGKPYMRVLPGQLAFFTVLSLVPLIAILGTIAFVLCFVGTNLIIMACNIKNNRNAK